MNDKLDKETAYSIIRNIFDKKVLIIVGTGASMAVDPEFGMVALAEELRRKMPDAVSSDKKLESSWNKINEKIKDTGLEKALDGINNEELRSTIIKIAGNFVTRIDAEYKKKSLSADSYAFPMEKFLLKLFSSLSVINPCLNIITPNYDLLIEHICDKNKIPYCTGFTGGITKYYEWNTAEKEMYYTKNISGAKKKPKKVERIKKHIKLHKVHGSLNWFWQNQQIIEDNSLVYDREHTLKRAIIPPGDAKIPEAFMNYRDFFTRADKAIASDDAYIFAGYGFNDIHIEKEIDKHLKINSKHGVIITKELSNKAKNLINMVDNLWAVFQDPDNSANTLIKNRKYNNHLIIEHSDLWMIDKLTDIILGG
ncbi:MAG: SIR2 family protein [Deltaproteobacteria bacterium]|nr:SIR2 family protein [Deltaproteobacteria bacterium]